MKLQNMFQKDVNRDINGVVKVMQNDEGSLQQELDEYIITTELRKHFRTFFDNYSRAIAQPTDKIGVWISGFFGSGKSHFLKILSYLLSNQEVCGKRVIDYFVDKFDDPATYDEAVQSVAVPTESILFNIDVEGLEGKDKTAILRVFAKMFYKHCGFYGDDMKVTKLELFVEKQGKTEQFRAAFEERNGNSWLESRDAYAFWEDDIVAVLHSVLGMSEQAARNWFNGTETSELSIASLVDDVKKYVDEKGEDFRLLFMVDEVGQYIGDDGNLMLNLQSLVEELGARCRGKVWVMVTSQEAIDSIVRVAGDDFSKIQGRFNTRLSLSSSSVDEVIKKRILAKTDEADALLRRVYGKEHAVLKNLYTFNNPVLDVKGFSDDAEFAAAFPFVPYQFILIQKALAEIRKHGNSGKHLSGGERSMLSGFQEAAQKVQDRDENALAPFYLFYDTVHTFLESHIRQRIDRCQKAAENCDGLEPLDVDVLKLLYLVRYIDDIKANLDNIAILMIDDVRTDKIKLRTSIKESLERLESQNYISRNGDTYAFQTDEEAEITLAINRMQVDNAKIVGSIASTVFNEIYPSAKFRYDERYNAIPFNKYIDGTAHGSVSEENMTLRIVTVAGDLYNEAEARLTAESTKNQAIVVLSKESSYFQDLEEAMKIRKYVKQRNVAQLAESAQEIIHWRQKKANVLENQARENIEKAIVGAKFYVCGDACEISSGTAKEKLYSVLSKLVDSVYTHLKKVDTFVDNDADIQAILNGAAQQGVIPGTGPKNNQDALDTISQWLETKVVDTTAVGDVQRRYSKPPYGWREIDIAALLARLIVQQKIVIRYAGSTVSRNDCKLVDYLRKKSEIDNALVVLRKAAGKDTIDKSVTVLSEYLNTSVPRDEDGLVAFTIDRLTSKSTEYQNLLDGPYQEYAYPGKDDVVKACGLINDVLSQKKDNVTLLTRLVEKKEELWNSAEEMETIVNFFESQRTIYDKARAYLESREKERDNYLQEESEALSALDSMKEILNDPKPYTMICKLDGLIRKVQDAYDSLLTKKRDEVLEKIRNALEDIHTSAENWPTIRDKADDDLSRRRENAKESDSLTALDAMLPQIERACDNYACQLRRAIEAKQNTPFGPASGNASGQSARVVASAPKPKIVSIYSRDLFPQKKLRTAQEVEEYVKNIREKLLKALNDADEVKIY